MMAATLYINFGCPYWIAVMAVSLLKLLLLNSYRSTDFEVHRNWLAITHSLPMEKWYYEKTSQWTLDYPPLFAYFEWALSQAAKYFDPGMLKVSNLNYASFNTVLFQKLSVILVDLVLAYAVLKCTKASSRYFDTSASPSTRGSSRGSQLEALFVLIFLNGGLFMVDHIHFQYNGFLFGILLLAIAECLEGNYYVSAFIFAALINFKHIFLYMAPAFGIYLFRRHCLPPNRTFDLNRFLTRTAYFAAAGLSVLAISFGPFYKHVPQILSRLFPFQRGLSHAYWAPNVWALYNTFDWILNIAFGKGNSSVTSGLVGDRPMQILPNVTPLYTLILTVIFMAPALITIWQKPTEKNFIRGIIAAAWTSYMFGYHVHEKAILNVMIPFSLIALQEPRMYFMTLVPATVSLFPLLFTPFEIVLKAVISILHLSLTLVILPKMKFNRYETAYLAGFAGVYAFENLAPVLLPRFPFMPLMLISDYTFLGIAYSYYVFYKRFARIDFNFKKPMVMTLKPRKVYSASESESDAASKKSPPQSPKAKKKSIKSPDTPSRALRRRN